MPIRDVAMSDQITERYAARLKRLYEEAGSRVFFDWASSRQRDRLDTSVDTVVRECKMDRDAALRLLQKLASAGFGRFYNGRRGKKTRIEWSFSLRDIGAAARGALEDVGEIDPDAAESDDDSDAGMLGHAFNLRPGVQISLALPADLTTREADRLAAFVKTLPLGE